MGNEISGIVHSLLQDETRTFSFVEMKFFKMWWDLQDDFMRENVKKLVANKQLELINGGWAMHDEACPTYTDMIENMMFGHKFILEEFEE